MPVPAADALFRRGLAALNAERPGEALGHFRAAMLLEREHHVQRADSRYLSYYGLSLALAERPSPEAIRACETAVRLEPINPDMHLNLGRVYLLARKMTKALAVFEKGLSIAPAHPALQVQLQLADRRKRRALTFLSRTHALNRWLGRLRASLKRGS